MRQLARCVPTAMLPERRLAAVTPRCAIAAGETPALIDHCAASKSKSSSSSSSSYSSASLGVELAEADSILAAFVGVVEAIVGWSHFLIAAHGITATPYSFIDSQFQLVIPLSIRPSGLRPRLR